MTVFNELSEKKAFIWRNEYLAWFSLVTIVGFTWLPLSYYLMMSWHWIVLWQIGFFCLGAYTIVNLRSFDRPVSTLGYGFDRLILVFCCGLSGSILFANFKPVAAWQTSILICYILLLYILKNWLNNGIISLSRLHTALTSIAIVTGCISLQGWWGQLSIGNYRNHLPFGHHNFVAGYCVLLVPITLALAFIRSGWQRYSILAGSGLLCFILYTTSSRGGYLGFLAMTVGAAILFLWHSPQQKRIKRIAIVACIFLLLTVAALNNSRVKQIVKIGNDGGNAPLVQLKIDSESRDRLLMLQSAAKLVRERPIFGVGPGNMSRSYNRYRSVHTGIGAVNVQQLHNTPLHIVGELGIVGLGCYLALLGIILRLFVKLDRQLREKQDKYLLYAIGASLLGYIFSSLTDYQLENIAISSTIVALIAMLIALADKARSQANSELQPHSLSPKKRRALSLACLTILVSFLTLWIPVSAAMQLSESSLKDYANADMAAAYEKISKASTLAPWDPTYYLLAVDRVSLVRSHTPAEDKEQYNELTDIMLKNLEKAHQAAPNDDLINYFLGMTYMNTDLRKAETHLGRSIQLVPRSPFYTYYLLALAYIEQKQTAKAITALAIQSLVTPEFLTNQLWEDKLIADLYEPTAKETIQLLTQLLDRLTPSSPYYNSIAGNLTFLKWWTKQPSDKQNSNEINPIHRAIFLAETQPQAALELVEKTIKEQGESDALFILRAWLAPDKYLMQLVPSTSTITIENRNLIVDSIKENRNIRDWLSSLDYSMNDFTIPGFRLAYRNNYGQAAAKFPYPRGIVLNFLANILSLTAPYPYTLDTLDDLIAESIATKLDLPAISESL